MRERPDRLLNLNDQQVEDMMYHLLYFGQLCAADKEDAIHETAAGLMEQVAELQTFERAGFLTTDSGLVLTLMDGSVFQLTIQRSKGPEFFEDEEE